MTRLALAACLATGIIACSGPSGTVPSATAASTDLSSPVSEATVAAEYYRAVAARNYHRAFTYLAPKATGPSGHELTWPAFSGLAHTLDNEAGPVTRFSVGGFRSLVVMTINRKRAGPYHAHLTMTRSTNGWLIVSIDRI